MPILIFYFVSLHRSYIKFNALKVHETLIHDLLKCPNKLFGTTNIQKFKTTEVISYSD